MTNKQTILLLGATGETGKSVLDGLLEDGGFVNRPSSISSGYKIVLSLTRAQGHQTSHPESLTRKTCS